MATGGKKRTVMFKILPMRSMLLLPIQMLSLNNDQRDEQPEAASSGAKIDYGNYQGT
ncbi:hypothetical protein PanWU01x14_240450 [Parasponia andersonii]|uniref:Transmembrane protein n=1 Tax=Parasponia andersonii TaxID=3476 RepID=A0A2P5BGR2_PARAD|nr:hypothetical protein PanWU01x14_240450 [Parasponia andersonii]